MDRFAADLHEAVGYARERRGTPAPLGRHLRGGRSEHPSRQGRSRHLRLARRHPGTPAGLIGPCRPGPPSTSHGLRRPPGEPPTTRGDPCAGVGRPCAAGERDSSDLAAATGEVVGGIVLRSSVAVDVTVSSRLPHRGLVRGDRPAAGRVAARDRGDRPPEQAHATEADRLRERCRSGGHGLVAEPGPLLHLRPALRGVRRGSGVHLPWATQLERYGSFGLVEMGIFVFVLLLGLVYAWRKGVLRWV